MCSAPGGGATGERNEKDKKEGKERAGLTGKGEGCHPQGSGNRGVTPLSSPPLSEIRPKANKQTHLLFEDTWSHLGPQPQHAGGKGTEGPLMWWGWGRGHGPGTWGALETGLGYGTGDTWHNVPSLSCSLGEGCASEGKRPEPSSSPSPANTSEGRGNAS